MCEVMARDCGSWLSVSRAESQVGKEGRTIDLLEWLLAQHADTRFEWVIGSDILADLPKWKSWDRIEALVEVVVVHRAGYPSSRALGPGLAEVSSSEIRKALLAGQQPNGLVPRAVLEYAQREQLYVPAPG